MKNTKIMHLENLALYGNNGIIIQKTETFLDGIKLGVANSELHTKGNTLGFPPPSLTTPRILGVLL